MAKIDFSGDFGGSDAAEISIPIWRALKDTGQDFVLSSITVSELHFILRVDGEVRVFGGTGLGPIENNKKDGFVSIDLELSESDRPRLVERVAELIVQSADLFPSEHLLTGKDELQQELLEFSKKFVEGQKG